MRFHVFIEATFDADDIDDAIEVVTRHISPEVGVEDGWVGEIEIGPA